VEHFRLSRFGQLGDTQFRLVPQGDAYAFRHPSPWGDDEDVGGYDYPYESGPYAQERGWMEGPSANAPAPQRPDPGAWWWEDNRSLRPQRIDPDYFWGNRQVY